jgi:Protein of unknown function (DUF1573)
VYFIFQMKKTATAILAIGWLLATGACNPKPNPAAAASLSAVDAPTMKFEEATFDFGAINAGDVVTHVFRFTNAGKTPLVIENAVASCGCTVPDWPRKPIAANGSGEVKVEFNSRGKAGPQQKTVTITANTNPRETVLVLVGTVNSAAEVNP